MPSPSASVCGVAPFGQSSQASPDAVPVAIRPVQRWRPSGTVVDVTTNAVAVRRRWPRSAGQAVASVAESRRHRRSACDGRLTSSGQLSTSPQIPNPHRRHSPRRQGRLSQASPMPSPSPSCLRGVRGRSGSCRHRRRPHPPSPSFAASAGQRIARIADAVAVDVGLACGFADVRAVVEVAANAMPRPRRLAGRRRCTCHTGRRPRRPRPSRFSPDGQSADARSSCRPTSAQIPSNRSQQLTFPVVGDQHRVDRSSVHRVVRPRVTQSSKDVEPFADIPVRNSCRRRPGKRRRTVDVHSSDDLAVRQCVTARVTVAVADARRRSALPGSHPVLEQDSSVDVSAPRRSERRHRFGRRRAGSRDRRRYRRCLSHVSRLLGRDWRALGQLNDVADRQVSMIAASSSGSAGHAFATMSLWPTSSDHRRPGRWRLRRRGNCRRRRRDAVPVGHRRAVDRSGARIAGVALPRIRRRRRPVAGVRVFGGTAVRRRRSSRRAGSRSSEGRSFAGVVRLGSTGVAGRSP